MKGFTAAIVSAFPAGAPWLSKAEAAPPLRPDGAADAAQAVPDAGDATDATTDLADLLRHHDDVMAAERQSFNNRLVSLLNCRRELPANDRRRLNALLAELLDNRDNLVASEREGLPASVVVSFDHAVDGIVKSLNEHFATNTKSSIVPGQRADGQ